MVFYYMLCIIIGYEWNTIGKQQQRYELDMVGISDIYTIGSQGFPLIAIAEKREAMVIMP